MICVQSLTKTYARGNALADVSFEIPAGEVCGLIGPNGAGKTTLLRILATLLTPSGGEASIAGNCVRQSPDLARRSMGYMADSFGTYEELRVDSFLTFFAHLYDIEEDLIAPTIEDLLTLVDLIPLRHTPIAQLSLGVRQRLSLARVLLHNPSVLLLDEPVSGLDPRARVEMRSLLRELGTMGKTILISSHILADLADLCDRILVLEGGRVAFNGTLPELQKRVHQTPALEVGWQGDMTQLEAHFRQQTWVNRVEQLGHRRLRAWLELEHPELEEISQQLFDLGHAPTHFNLAVTDLEEAFMRLTQGKVS